jgi:hypothetical protein
MDREKPVDGLVTLTFAPAKAAPDASRATPAIVPVGTCAFATPMIVISRITAFILKRI